jgi:hypothetical protein
VAEPRKQHPSWRELRDGILFFAGLLGVAHQTLYAKQPNVELLVVFGSMMGLPAFLRKDEKKHEEDEKDAK